MRRRIPMIICFVSGLFMSLRFFIPHRYSQIAYRNALDWMQIVFVFTLVVGIGSVIRHHGRKLMKLKPGWFYSIFTLAGLGLMAILGLFGGIEEGTPYMWIFKHVQAPMQATMMSLLAFFIASAAYRGFRARSKEAAILLAAGFIVMLGRVPVGHSISPLIPTIANWILDVPNTAAMRGITIGIGLGIIATSLRIILGIERTYLGKE
jgi:hypothetical protein